MKISIATAMLLIAIFPLTANATVTRLTSYNALLTALKNGHRVSVVADNAKCKIAENTRHQANDPDDTAIMGLNFNTNFFLVYHDENDPRNYITTIATNAVVASDFGSHFRYKRVRVFDDNSVEIFASWAKFPSGESKGYSRYLCALSNGSDQNGASLFDYD